MFDRKQPAKVMNSMIVMMIPEFRIKEPTLLRFKFNFLGVCVNGSQCAIAVALYLINEPEPKVNFSDPTHSQRETVV